MNQPAQSGSKPEPHLGHLPGTPWIGGYRTSLARIGPDDKFQFDGQKQDQFRSSAIPDPADL
jgi:hypothetical protein